MWSVVQYRRIGQKIEQDWRNSKTHHGGSGNELLDQQAGNNSVPSSQQHAESEPKDTNDTNGNSILVSTSGDDDPMDPRNWPLTSRCKNIAILSLLIFVQGWAGAADSMANSNISKEFGVSKVAENLSQALYLFGIGSGCLFAGPLSESVGRNPTYLVSTFCYMLFVLGSALTPNFGGQVVCRYFVGLFASATLGINGASVQDQFRPVKRAFVFPIIAWANVAGNVYKYRHSGRSS
jgi:MFS transporter, DHA1 family, multidrug resistance protein